MTMLHLAGTYRREVMASLPRIHENVHDWEHLPALHASNFAACELIETHARGWRIRLVPQPGNADAAQTLKLDMAENGLAYTVITEPAPVRFPKSASASPRARNITPASKSSITSPKPIPSASPSSAPASSRSTRGSGMRTKR